MHASKNTGYPKNRPGLQLAMNYIVRMYDEINAFRILGDAAPSHHMLILLSVRL